jgi:short subunit dehydrogenase-like uncharacterized protein
MSQRITVVGSTCTLGQYVTKFLAARIKQYPESYSNLQIVLAAANHKKVNLLVNEISEKFGVKFNSVVVETKDEDALDALVKSSKVVISATNRYGTILVDFCVKNGVHYCDLVGDSTWIAELIRNYNDSAMKNNMLVVSSCGLLSLPSDLGTFFLIDYVRKKYEVGVKQVVGSISLNSSSVFENLRNFLSAAVDNSNLVGYLNPYVLNPIEDKEYPPNGKVHSCDIAAVFPSFDHSQKRYNSTSVLCMASQNIVRRSGRLYNQAGFKYGKDFHYKEFLSTSNFISSIFQILIYFIFKISLLFHPLLELLKKIFWILSFVFSNSKTEKESFKVHLTADIEGKTPKKVRAIVVGNEHLSKESAKMLAESGMILALQDKQLKVKGGVVTPAFAFGNILIERLYKSGIKFEIIED